MSYRPTTLNTPVVSGLALRALASAAGSALGGPIRAQLLKEANIPRLMSAPVDDPALPPPLTPSPGAHPTGDAPTREALLARALDTARPSPGFAFESVSDFVAAYRDGITTPEVVAERVIAAIAASEEGDKPLRIFIAHDAEDLRAQAQASAARHAAGAPLSPLDGVPVAVKDELDMLPYPTTAGTRVLGASPAAADSTVAARLRAAGALLIGKANMHEIGIGVTGLNPHHGVCRNPYDPAHHTGGSSSGSGAAVAAGLGPFAVGADGGGSIRIPAAFCGLVGLKATFGRISEHGVAPLCWSVGHVGPLAATVADAAAAFAVMAGEDPGDPNTLRRPAPHLDGLDADDLAGVRLGVFRPWFEDADEVVVETCDALVARLREAGATVHEVEIPDLDVFRTAHLVLIASEMLAGQGASWPARRAEYGLDVQVNLSLASAMHSDAYVHALRHRARAARVLGGILGGVDAILTPATACAAPPIPERTLPAGESNLPLLDRIMRFAQLPNLTGFPAISMPAGYTPEGLPVGLQAIGRPWEESLLLRIARVAEALVERRRPAAWRPLLG